MAGDATTGLQHVPTGNGLANRATRNNMLARGLRDAGNVATNPAYLAAVAAYRAGEFIAAAAHFLQAAEQGHTEAQYFLSTMLEAGEGVAQNDAEAMRWERRAAEQGHAYAQANVSFRCYTDDNFHEAFAWCQRAALSMLPWAQYNLGLMYRKGEGVQQDDAEAARWYRLAAEQDFADAQAKLADLYSFGTGVPLSYAQAAAWYRRAAEQGHAEAQYQLAHLYGVGQGVDPDYTQSRYWIRQAALQGHEAALRELKQREYRDA